MFIKHYGTPRHSGRYEWGSGENPYQRSSNFLAAIKELSDEGLKESEIAKGLGMKTDELRARKTSSIAIKRAADSSLAMKLKDKGMSNVAIGKRMGINESSVRSLLDPAIKAKSEETFNTMNMLKNKVAEKKYIDVGVGVERNIGISRTKLKSAIILLQDEGYQVHKVFVKQVGTGKMTTVLALTEPGVDKKEVFHNMDKIQQINDYTPDKGMTYYGLKPVQSISSDRIKIRYAEDGGDKKDGVMELRRGVDDLSLGDSRYAQVRIGVDDTHYLKGMAVYGTDLPKGVDIVFNTNKSSDTPKMSVLKKMEVDENGTIDLKNPFGAQIKSGGQRGALNIVNEEGDWTTWKKSLSSQVLSKQKPEIAKKQLDLAYEAKKLDFDSIKEVTSPEVKRKLLMAMADGADSAAIHLKAAGLPRQASYVILPFDDLKDNEVYAPHFRPGEKVALIRYPHGGRFEIPELTVNNRAKGPNEVIKQAKDAIGINSRVAERLSGADFDGDTVLVIPNNNRDILNSPPLKALEDFNPRVQYAGFPGMKKMTTTGLEMGLISNLITDMTIAGATNDELARAIKHSMVVIDAEKHGLNYTQSYKDNNIAKLKRDYQGSARGGAVTLVSKAKKNVKIPERKEGIIVTDPVTGKTKRQYIDPKTGEKLYWETGNTYVNKEGKEITPHTKVPLMSITKDAHTLSSGTQMEKVYADYANSMKKLANDARLELLKIETAKVSPSAKKVYAKEVQELKAHLNTALKNKPKERQAHLIANSVIEAKIRDNPKLEDDDLKKIKWKALAEARHRVGANKIPIDITPRQWEAIQNRALSSNIITQIFDNADLDQLKAYATPREDNKVSAAILANARARLARGYTQSEVADALGISISTINDLL